LAPLANELGEAAEILVVDRNPYHNIRVRNYEVDLNDCALPLAELLDPVGIHHLTAEVCAIDPVDQKVTIRANDGLQIIRYDRAVLTLGSELARPAIPGLASHGFDVDTYAAAVRLNEHLAALSRLGPSPECSTVVVVGAGFTGIEVATEMPAKLARAGIGKPRVILIDPNPVVGATIGESGRPAVHEALSVLGVETRLGVRVAAVGPTGITLSCGEIIPARTVVWCAGMEASGSSQ
jgi:NADH:ubiquinone reductase (H+-translocating)